MSNSVGVDRARENGGLRFRFSFSAVEAGMGSLDLVFITAVAIAADLAYRKFGLTGAANIGGFVGVGLLTGVLLLCIAKAQDLYAVPELLSGGGRFKPLIASWAVAVLLTVLFLYLLKIGADYSRGSMLLFFGFGLLVLLANRLVAAAVLHRALKAGMLVGRRAIIVGQPDELSAVIPADLISIYGMNEVGRVTLPRAAGGEHRGFNDFGGIDRAMSLARERMADDIVVALDWKDEDRIKVVRDRLRACPLPVLLLPDRSMTRILSYSGNRRSAGLSLCLQRSPLTIGELAEKRLIDTALSLTAILLLLPLLILVAAAIKLDSSGPIIFRQWRNGFNGRPFRILKFRTMHVMEDGPVIKQAEKIDPRVTRVGRILRRTSADELPQLFNVLLGHMSLVGPRPHAMAHDSIYSAQIADYAFRHHVKPGLTGWAQVNGNRGETPRLQDMERRIKCDLWYINHRSLILDLRIILRTCLLVARGDPAH